MAEALLHDKLNLETARIHWQELQPHFARGAAVYPPSFPAGGGQGSYSPRYQ